MQHFFGLTLESNQNFANNVLEEIFTLVNYGNGFTYSDVVKMPIHIRKWMIAKLYDSKKKEREMQEKEANRVKNKGKK